MILTVMPDSGADSTADANGALAAGPTANPDDWSIGTWLLLFVGIAVLCFGLYQPALEGTFVSDDVDSFISNPFVNELSAENLAAIFDLRASEKSFTANYAPINELLMTLERHFFGNQVLLYHALNILFHTLNSVLLIAWLRSSRLPATAALLGGLIFAVHPANVEAVAWMSQIKTNAALAFSLLALLAFRPAPLAATCLFAVALLTKASALFALPTVAALVWARRGEPGGGRGHWIWVGIWVLVFGLYAVPEFASFQNFGEVKQEAYADIAEQARSIAAYGSRYLVMATTSWGLSAFHEPEPARSVFDPWWLAAMPLGALLLWRIAVAVRRRSEEAAWWLAAAAAYAPISQIFPFIYPMGDRYLYFALPGLIGGSLFATLGLWDGVRSGSPGKSNAPRVAVACVLLVALFFGYRSFERAGVWRNATRLYLDAERHYPDGGPANMLRARRAAQVGDVAGAIEALGRAEERGFADFMSLPEDRALAPISGTLAFHDFVRGMAGRWIERSRTWRQMNQAQYHLLAHAHMLRGENAEATSALEDAIAAGGPQDAVLRSELAELRLNASD